MRDPEAPAWWAGVEHLREGYERRDGARRDREDLAARRAARERARHRRDAAPHHHDPAPQRPAPAPAPQRSRPQAAPAPASARRTIVIRGQAVPAPTVPRLVDVERRRPPRRPVERVGPRPDRIAMWALLMGIGLILVAVGTADAAVAAAFAS